MKWTNCKQTWALCCPILRVPTTHRLGFGRLGWERNIDRVLDDLGNQTLMLNGTTISENGTYKNFEQFDRDGTFNGSFTYACDNTAQYHKKGDDEQINYSYLATPNPANEYVVFSAVAKNEHITNFKVYDVTGRLVLTGNTQAKPFAINISQLEDGFYSVSFDSDFGRVTTGRFIKAN